MKSRNIKVVDEHNIDREANIIFGFDLEGSEYVTYWIERDEESNNVFVSKVVKNLDDTFNLANIEDEFEKENVSKVVKTLIAKSVSDEADKLVGDTITLESGKTIKFISVSFNKEQRIDVKKTYITTVKKEVTKVSEKYYDVLVTIEEPKLVSEEIQDIFPNVEEPVLEQVEESPVQVEPVAPVIPEPVIVPETPVVVPEPSSVVEPEVLENEVVNDQFVTFGVPEQESVGTVVETITNEPVLETSNVLVEEVPVLETPVVEKHETPLVSSQPLPEEPKVILPEPVIQTPVVESVAPVVPEEVIVSETPVAAPVTPSVVEPVAVPVVENQPLIFNASKETNLNAALGEVAKDTTIPVENIESVREFGEEAPALSQTPTVPVQPAIAPMTQPVMSSEPMVLTKKAGFANSKFFMVVAVAFFLASCVFLGYEVFNYFQLSK